MLLDPMLWEMEAVLDMHVELCRREFIDYSWQQGQTHFQAHFTAELLPQHEATEVLVLAPQLFIVSVWQDHQGHQSSSTSRWGQPFQGPRHSGSPDRQNRSSFNLHQQAVPFQHQQAHPGAPRIWASHTSNGSAFPQQ